jgi:hypothetical protein
MSEKYETHVKSILSECPDADPEEVAAAFEKYETEFFIPPQDAMRSILRRFKGDKTPTPSSGSSGGSSAAPRNTRKVSSLSELKGDDKDIEIEVEIISHNIRDQTIRGEQKQIAFGLLEDNPWEENGQKKPLGIQRLGSELEHYAWFSRTNRRGFCKRIPRENVAQY